MSKRYKNRFRDTLLEKIAALPSNVILWSDLQDQGSARQISRALNDYIADGILVRIGRGIYAKTKTSKYIDEPVISGGFEEACIEALKRLNIRWELGALIKAYNEGKTQQVPAQFQVRLKDRFRRTLSYGNNQIRFEGGINAK